MEKSKLQELIEDAGYETRSYSGRAMYGQECLGVDVPSGGLGGLVADVLTAFGGRFADGLVDGVRLEDTAMWELAEAFRGMATDSLGRGTIVYFPSTPYAPPAGATPCCADCMDGPIIDADGRETGQHACDGECSCHAGERS